MRATTERLRRAISARTDEAVGLLHDLIAIPSLSGQEEPAVRRMTRAFEDLPNATTCLAPIPATIVDDPDFSWPDPGRTYAGRNNLRVLYRAGSPSGARRVIVQTHLDVAPATDWPEAFAPRITAGAVVGRGACDCKGQAAVLWLALTALADCKAETACEALAQFAVEEEIGGNGALAMILGGDRADAVIVLEPTSGNVHPANRGAVWFRITLEGTSVHMGRKHDAVSALDKAVTVMGALEEYERRLVAEAAESADPLFARYAHPVQVNVGILHAGDWPSTVPGVATLEGGVGFLPDRSMASVCGDLKALLQTGDPWVRDHHTLEFPKLHNDAYALDPAHPLVTALHRAARSSGFPQSQVSGWNVSCDARLYALRGKMPTVVFGAGDLASAHSSSERVAVSDLQHAALTLCRFLLDWR